MCRMAKGKKMLYLPPVFHIVFALSNTSSHYVLCLLNLTGEIVPPAVSQCVCKSWVNITVVDWNTYAADKDVHQTLQTLLNKNLSEKKCAKTLSTDGNIVYERHKKLATKTCL